MALAPKEVFSGSTTLHRTWGPCHVEPAPSSSRLARDSPSSSSGSTKKAMSKDCPVPILEMLSKSLREELALQRHAECLKKHQFLGGHPIESGGSSSLDPKTT